jgi:hypothetical protein
MSEYADYVARMFTLLFSFEFYVYFKVVVPWINVLGFLFVHSQVPWSDSRSTCCYGENDIFYCGSVAASGYPNGLKVILLQTCR